MSLRKHVKPWAAFAIAAVLLSWGQVAAQDAASSTSAVESHWAQYYDLSAGRRPRPLLLEALDHFEAEGKKVRRAVDAGCGAGVETRFLAEMGVDVLAFDAEAEGIDRLRQTLSEEQAKRVRTEVAMFHEADWGQENDLVFAGYALPFAHPDDFPAAWAKLKASLASGGRFAGHLFGDRDDWARRPGMTFHRREQVEELLSDGFEVEVLREVEWDGPQAMGGDKHWHVFEIIARKR